MKPQISLRISLSVLLAFTFLFSSFRSNATEKKDRRTFSIHSQVNAERSSDHSINLDLSLPVNSKKEKEKDHSGTDLFRHKRHTDEDRHDHHHHHFDKVKHKRKIVNLLSAWLLKIFIALSYFSILLCSYMSLGHH